MIDILKNEELTLKLTEMRGAYLIESKQFETLDDYFNIIENISEWKYSTGPIFDQPPYSLEMAGFDGGHILKKIYPSPYEARLKGAYSSGFIEENHAITIYPAKPSSMPLQANFYKKKGHNVITHSISSNKATDEKSKKPPKLLGIGEIFNIQEDIMSYVGVGKGDAYVIRLFYYDEEHKVVKASMITAPSNFQNDFYFEYDETKSLKSIQCNGVIWERKNKLN